MVLQHNSKQKSLSRTDATHNPNLTIVGDGVYDISEFRNTHPGGQLFVSLFGSGRDATNVFLSYHRRAWPVERMAQYKVAMLSEEKTPEDPLYLELAKEVNRTISGGGFAPWWYYVKVIVLIACAVAVEIKMFQSGRTLLYSFIQGLFFAWIGLNIQHDANHGSISRHPAVNRLLGLTQDWIGGSSILWLQEHVVLHHPHTNDQGGDPDMEGAPMFRMRPIDDVRPHHRFQHLYILPLELLYGWAPIIGQISELVRKAWAGRPISELAQPYILTSNICKALFLIRFLVIPLVLEPKLSTLGLISVTTAVGGFYLAFFFALSHNFEGVAFFDQKSNKNMGFLEKQVLSSSTLGGALLGFFNGGLNYQIEHHLFPRIHHSHYPTIAPVVRAFCAKHNIHYNYFPNVATNVVSMIQHLRILGIGADKKKTK